MLARFVGFVLMVLLVAPACGRAEDDSDTYNRVSFGVDSGRDVENDQATAVIGVTHEDTDPARLAERINQDVQWGLDLAKAESAVKVRTSGYRTYPVSDPKQNRLRRWRGGQDLVLESKDPKALSELLGRLQEKLQLQNLSFSVSPERRRATEGELIDEALAAFRARADRVRAKLDARSYELVDVRIDTAAAVPPTPRMRSMAVMAEAAATPPPLEGGTSRLTVQVFGTVELTF
ncbi:MAG: SIMPL domain-containing protein [Myxococcota bacterium]